MIHVYTGNGKGKTTAAVGLAIRALGRGQKALIIQWLKGRAAGEMELLKKMPGVDCHQFGREQFVQKDSLQKEDHQEAQKGLETLRKAIRRAQYQLIVLDEINVALELGLVEAGELLPLLGKCPTGVELVLTGRNAPQELVEQADYVTEMREIKHPYQKGVKARKGVEY
jgi:cob(I)alamin adenosyltransferase